MLFIETATLRSSNGSLGPHDKPRTWVLSIRADPTLRALFDRVLDEVRVNDLVTLRELAELYARADYERIRAINAAAPEQPRRPAGVRTLSLMLTGPNLSLKHTSDDDSRWEGAALNELNQLLRHAPEMPLLSF